MNTLANFTVTNFIAARCGDTHTSSNPAIRRQRQVMMHCKFKASFVYKRILGQSFIKERSCFKNKSNNNMIIIINVSVF